MQKIYATPGPSHPHPRLREFIDDAWDRDIMAISHRGKAFTDVYSRTVSALQLLMGVPSDYLMMFVGSATEAMERTIQGTVIDRSHHFIQGEFAEKWYRIATQLGKHPTATRASAGGPFPNLDVPVGTELVCITHNETSTGAIVPETVLDLLVSSAHHPLIALDVVSSAPMTTLPWASLDLVFFSVQKAFGLPAGLGVLIVSPRAARRSRQLEATGVPVGSYHSLSQLAAGAEKFQTPATPNVLGIYLLGSVAEDMLTQGIEALQIENAQRAQQLYKILSRSEFMRPFIVDELWRSPTVIVAEVEQGSDPLLRHMEKRQLVIGRGYKDFANQQVRIANFPAIDEPTFHVLAEYLQQYAPA